MKAIPKARYDNAYFPNNVYGHALALLLRHRGSASAGGVHLDVGCGFGRIAEALTGSLGLTYVGVDDDPEGLGSLQSRGFETHRLWLNGEDQTYEALRGIIAGRVVASMTLLDTLEHLVDGDATLRALRRIAADTGSFVCISVPNVAHRDVGFKLAFGQWDYTDAGLLDDTHVRLFNDAGLVRVLRGAGLHITDMNDVLRSDSDQQFPAEHPALARGTTLHRVLAALRAGADGSADINQFVRLCVPGPREATGIVAPPEPKRPFLSVVTRTQGRRLHTLREVFTAMAAQTDTDFEMLVVGHRLPIDRQLEVERVIDDNPAWLRSRIRLVLVEQGNRTHPLNVGFDQAVGSYISVLDDDDLPMAHWIETFRRHSQDNPGKLIRAATVRQTVRTVHTRGVEGLRAEGGLDTPYPSTFDFLEHLRVNLSPPCSVAFPRGTFHHLNIRFDETLTTTEDWDFIMRTAAVVGVVSVPDVTSIYRWWQQGESSRTVHLQDEWRRNHARVMDRLDESVVLFPPGTTGRIRELLNWIDHLAGRANGEAPLGSAGRAPLCHQGELVERVALLEEIHVILESTSWRVTAPLRSAARALGRPKVDRSHLWSMSALDLASVRDSLLASRSWSMTAPLRALKDVVRGRPR